MFGERVLRILHHVLIVLAVVGTSIALMAQTVVDPRYVEFTPSVDHNAVHTDGTTLLVERYSLSIYQTGSSTATDTMDLGKPAPDGSNIIRVDFRPLLHVTLTPSVTYEARVTAVGPGGSTPSTVSNGFYFQPTCTPGISPTSVSPAGSGATGSVAVTVANGCTWSAVSNAAWITLTGATSGNGNGSVPYSVAANSTTSPRSGTLTIAGQTFTVNQSGASCSYSLSPTSQSVAAGGATGSTNVTAPGGCSWTAASNASSWLTVTGGSSGNGNGTVNFSASANPNASTRSGTLTIGGQTFTVNQAAATCSFSISPTGQSLGSAGGTGSTTVTAPGGCNWTASSNASSWLSITSGSSGSGSGPVNFSAIVNPNTSSRTGTLTVAGQTFTVTQAAAACTFALSPTSQSVVATGGTGSTGVTTSSNCGWTASSSAAWLTITSGASGTGNGTVSFSAAANPNVTTRSATLTVSGQTFTVNQAAAACAYAISPGSQSVAAGGGTGSTTVTAQTGCTWTATSNASWLTITGGSSGNGNGTTSFSAASNSTTQARSGTLTVAGQTFTVNQSAGSCSYGVSPTSQSVAASAGTGSATITTTSGCTWTAASNASFITVTSGATGTGNGTAAFSIQANSNTTSRTGTLTIAGQTFTVTQAAGACTYSLSPTSKMLNGQPDTGSFTVTTSAGCTWTAQSNATGWLTTVSSGTGSGSVAYVVTANAGTSARTGTITAGGQTFTVTQNNLPAPPGKLKIITQ